MVCYNNPMENKKNQISTPSAIIIAGVLIMIGILASRGGNSTSGPKTLSEQVGVSKNALAACIKDTDAEALNKSIDESVNKAMSNISGRGTPYSVIIGQGGAMTDVKGAESYENMKIKIEDAMVGKVSTKYVGNIALSEPGDHVMGSDNAKVTIIEYSDFECPYCKQFHPVLERIVKENDPNVRWIYRHYPLHQHSFEMLIASNCVAKIKGNDAFWKYADLLFDINQSSISDKL